VRRDLYGGRSSLFFMAMAALGGPLLGFTAGILGACQDATARLGDCLDADHTGLERYIAEVVSAQIDASKTPGWRPKRIKEVARAGDFAVQGELVQQSKVQPLVRELKVALGDLALVALSGAVGSFCCAGFSQGALPPGDAPAVASQQRAPAAAGIVAGTFRAREASSKPSGKAVAYRELAAAVASPVTLAASPARRPAPVVRGKNIAEIRRRFEQRLVTPLAARMTGTPPGSCGRPPNTRLMADEQLQQQQGPQTPAAVRKHTMQRNSAPVPNAVGRTADASASEPRSAAPALVVACPPPAGASPSTTPPRPPLAPQAVDLVGSAPSNGAPADDRASVSPCAFSFSAEGGSAVAASASLGPRFARSPRPTDEPQVGEVPPAAGALESREEPRVALRFETDAAPRTRASTDGASPEVAGASPPVGSPAAVFVGCDPQTTVAAESEAARARPAASAICVSADGEPASHLGVGSPSANVVVHLQSATMNCSGGGGPEVAILSSPVGVAAVAEHMLSGAEPSTPPRTAVAPHGVPDAATATLARCAETSRSRDSDAASISQRSPLRCAAASAPVAAAGAVCSASPSPQPTPSAARPSVAVATPPSVAARSPQKSALSRSPHVEASPQGKVHSASPRPTLGKLPVVPTPCTGRAPVEPSQALRAKVTLPEKRPEDNYELSDAGETSEEDERRAKERKKKPIPAWCDWGKDPKEFREWMKVLALQSEFDTDSIFGSRVPNCCTNDIFPDELYGSLQRERPRRRRGSSQDWRRDPLTRKEIAAYKTKMGQTKMFDPAVEGALPTQPPAARVRAS